MTHLERTIDFMKDLVNLREEIERGLSEEGADIQLIKDTLTIYKDYIKLSKRNIKKYKKGLEAFNRLLEESTTEDDYNYYLNEIKNYEDSIEKRILKIDYYTKYCNFLKSLLG